MKRTNIWNHQLGKTKDAIFFIGLWLFQCVSFFFTVILLICLRQKGWCRLLKSSEKGKTSSNQHLVGDKWTDFYSLRLLSLLPPSKHAEKVKGKAGVPMSFVFKVPPKLWRDIHHQWVVHVHLARLSDSSCHEHYLLHQGSSSPYSSCDIPWYWLVDRVLYTYNALLWSLYNCVVQSRMQNNQPGFWSLLTWLQKKMGAWLARGLVYKNQLVMRLNDILIGIAPFTSIYFQLKVCFPSSCRNFWVKVFLILQVYTLDLL